MVASYFIPIIQTLAVIAYYSDTSMIPDHGHYNEFNEDTSNYDYIIVGGGTSGSILASKLSEKSNLNILLIEAGGAAGNFYSQIPITAEALSYIPSVLFRDYYSIKQTKSCGLTDGICRLSAGNGLGGGSAHNDLMYVRGSPLDYDTYQRQGCTGWSYKDVLPIFEEFEDRSQNIGDFRANPEYFGKSFDNLGKFSPKIGVLRQTILPKLQNIFLKFFQNSGYFIGKYNFGTRGDKVGKGEVAIRRGRRSSSWNEYLKPVLRRKNLNILTFSKVIKINLIKNNRNYRATSIIYLKDGEKHEIKVFKELILSAGSVETSKLLMLSGIGNFNELTKLGVNPLIMHKPSVGANFQDHPCVFLASLSAGSMTLKSPNFLDFLQYLNHKNGSFSKVTLISMGFFIDKKTSINFNDTKVQLFILVDPALAASTMDLFFVMINPKSRGYVKLQSANPLIDPIIDPAYFKVEQDLNIFVRIVKLIIKNISRSKLLKNNGIKIIPTFIPNCGDANESSLQNEKFLKCITQQRAATLYHMTSTCKMGNRNDPNVVVDATNLKLIGSSNVRIVDASILPSVTRGNTNAPTTMIANKFIKELSYKNI